MKEKTIIERFKEQETTLNLVAEALGFMFKITLNSRTTAALSVYRKGEKITHFEVLNVEIKSQFQLIIKKGDEIITDRLYYKYLMVFLYNYLYYKDVEFLYQFNRRKI